MSKQPTSSLTHNYCLHRLWTDVWNRTHDARNIISRLIIPNNMDVLAQRFRNMDNKAVVDAELCAYEFRDQLQTFDQNS
jgi:hypothetical protein